MTPNTTRATSILLSALILASCTTNEQEADQTSAPSTSLVTVTSVGATVTTGPPDTSDGSSDPVVTDPPLIDRIGLARLTLLTPESGGGERPLLAWQPADGATLYYVLVFDPEGRTYWAWSTASTSVFMGGADLKLSIDIPRIADGMTWAVLAIGADDLPVAQSERRPIAP